MSELVVFTARENFDFLKFNSRVSAKQQEALKADCIMVQETQKLTAQTFGVWALRLVDLRDGGCWEDVINPKTGLAFFNEGFGAFCKHAFGLSETATSNLTKVAQFIQNHGDNVGELMGEYRGYSFSQLVELSSVSPSNRKYFSSDMTVKEMRTAKNYMKMGGFFQDKNNADFDLLKYSTGFEEERKSGVAKKNNPEVIPGQIELEDISDNVGVHINPTSELANACEEEVDIYDMPMQTHSYDNDDYDELDEAQADMQADMQTIEDESERSLPSAEEKTQYNFYTRTGVRAFLDDCLNWKKIDCSSPFISCYCYILKNKRRIYVYVQRTASKNDIDGIYGVIHRYFIDLPRYSDVPVEITKEQFEKYCAEHKDEL